MFDATLSLPTASAVEIRSGVRYDDVEVHSRRVTMASGMFVAASM